MNRKNIITTAIIAVCVIWVFAITFVITYKTQEKKLHPETTTIFSVPVATAAQESTTQPSTEHTTNESTGTTAPLSIDGNNLTTVAEYSNPSWVDESSSIKESYDAAIEQSKQEAQSSKEASKAAQEAKDKMPKSKADIIKAYNTALNKLKATENFKCTKAANLSISIDSVTGGSAVQNIVNQIIASKKQTAPETYNFVNFNDSATGASVNSIIPPDNAKAALGENDVKSATVEAGSNGSYVITITLGEDKQTLSSPASVYSKCVDTITLDALGLSSSMKVNTLDITYSNAVIKATIDSSGRITKLTHDVTVSDGHGTGKIVLINAEIYIHGSNTQTYTISY